MMRRLLDSTGIVSWARNYFEEKEPFKINGDDIERKNELDAGSTATVYKAIWNNTEVAVKDIKASTDLDCFQKEKSVFHDLASAKNPYIVTYYGYIEDNFSHAIVTEYMTNGDLNAYLQTCRIEIKEPQMLKFTGEIVRGMNFLHFNEIIHCDIKCENILLDKYNNTKLCDFGFSRYKKDIKNNNNLNGTPMCIAPELITPETDYTPYSEKSDVYAYSIVVYQIGNLTNPQHSEAKDKMLSDNEILDLTLDEKRPEITDKCPPFLAALTRRCWEQDPVKRPDTDEIIKDIEERMKLAL